MDKQFSSLMKTFSKYESEISSILGMLVVAALAVFLFLFVRKFMPKPAITQDAGQTQNQEDLMKRDEQTYTVKAGQGLSQIAKEVYNDASKWVAIAQANDLKSPYTLESGQVLKLPEAPTATGTPQASPVATTVASATPKATMAATPAPTATPVAKATPKPESTPSSSTATKYTVQAGDHLWKIAVAEYGSGFDWVKIYNANKELIGKNPGLIYVGQELSLPR